MSECFVFVQLPGQTVATVAGRFNYNDKPANPIGTFVYGRSYLTNENAVALDPVALPLREEEFSTTLTEGFFGILRDALPDDWGRHVAQRLYGERYANNFDLLLLPSADRFGALSFGQSSREADPEPPIGKLSDLTAQILGSLDKIDRDVALSDPERRAAIAFHGGTHAGGARPKITVEQDGAFWIAKLNRHDDKVNAVRVEASTLDLALECGIIVPEHRLETIGDHELLLVRRFDREIVGGVVHKHRTASASVVFRSDEAYSRNHYTGTYMQLSREFARWGIEVTTDRRQLFRRMAFNCLASITDDHDRNHALVATGRHFRLAPAFDLAPCRPTTRARRQALAIGAEGDQSTRENLLSAVAQFDLTTAEGTQTIDEVKEIITTRWRPVFVARGVPAADIEQLSECFDHTYFESGARSRSGLEALPQ